ncbi:MAG: carboxypeptidase regulatory-like domain-containing protein [Acidobacteria bacterium]|nr:carboxypeptidase regulatory-like domain-containing protein [Acidobacteriota bacterium]
MKNSGRLLCCCCFNISTLFVLGWLTTCSFMAQTGTSTVLGQVLDSTGKTIAGAKITVTNLQTSTVRTLVTSTTGQYLVTSLQPGTYRMRAEAQGFKTYEIAAVRAPVDQSTTVLFQMEVGETRIIVPVQVNQSEVRLNTQDATVGNTFVTRQITQLPLNLRDVAGLLSLQPAVTLDGSAAGSRNDQANYTLDGVDINDQVNGISFTPTLRLPADVVAEFRVTVTNPNAHQGRSSGAQVSLVTKSGSNEFHGSLYHFHRNSVTSANDFFSNRAGNKIPVSIRNVFGGAIGGPIRPNRLFFFFNYEGYREASTNGGTQVVPLPSLGRGELKFLDATGSLITLTAREVSRIYHQAGINPQAIALLADAARRYPANDLEFAGDGLNTGGIRFNVPSPIHQNTHTLRLDWTADQQGKHLIFGRYIYQTDFTQQAPALPDKTAARSWNHPSGIAAGHTWAISGTQVNNFRFGLTREALSLPSDSNQNHIEFVGVFRPFHYTRVVHRVTRVYNLTDDFTWTKDRHTVQFGGNVRLISVRNQRELFSYDLAATSPGAYEGGGAVLLRPLVEAGYTISGSSISSLQAAVAALIGRLNTYRVNFIYGRDGRPLPQGTPVVRNLATQEYDLYVQDNWRLTPNLTITYGLRYGLSRPVYERNGFQAATTVPLGDFFERRAASAALGIPSAELITVDLAGPANGKPGSYEFDKNNFQPRVALAWTPKFKKGGWLERLFGKEGDSVLRGGLAVVNDYYGIQIASQFDVNNALGFTSSFAIPPNTFNITNRLAPGFTGLGQTVRGFPGVPQTTRITFPRMQAADLVQRIEASIDHTVRTPYAYSVNFAYGRKLPAGLFVEAAYLGRIGRNVLATRDVMALNNLVDPHSGMDWYTAAGKLADYRDGRVPVRKATPIPWFENVLPRNFAARFADFFGDPKLRGLSATQAVYYAFARQSEGGINYITGGDWTYLQLAMDQVLDNPIFYNRQYGSLATWSSIGTSDYHGLVLTVRQRFRDQLIWDFNYTYSKWLDLSTGQQRNSVYNDQPFILNPFRPRDNRAFSEFDLRHVINANGIWNLPAGRGRRWLNSAPGWVDALLGGWQITGLFRWQTGYPMDSPRDASGWATNWTIRSMGIPVRPVASSPTRGGANPPNLFSDPVYASQSFRNARAGETGFRNYLRLPGYVTLDMGFNKFFSLPWSETHKLQFRCEVFNLTNTQRLSSVIGWELSEDNLTTQPSTRFGNLTSITGAPRLMQFGLRYTF